MHATLGPEARLLSVAEREIVNATMEPELGQATPAKLKSLVRRLRQVHQRAKHIAARQQREMRGKAEPHGARAVAENAGSLQKAQLLLEASQRLNAEIFRRNQAATSTQAELSRRALEMKLASHASQHPDGGPSASRGMQVKPRSKPVKIGTTRKEIGRVSQAGKVAQARKDSK